MSAWQEQLSTLTRYQAQLEDILKKIIQEEFRQQSFAKDLPLGMAVFKKLVLMRGKQEIDRNDIHDIVHDVIPKEPGASYIDSHKTLYTVVEAYRFVGSVQALTEQGATAVQRKVEIFATDFKRYRHPNPDDRGDAEKIAKARGEFCVATERFIKTMLNHNINRYALLSQQEGLMPHPVNDRVAPQAVQRKRIKP